MATTTTVKSTATTARKTTAVRPARKAPSKTVVVKAAVKSVVKPGAKRPPVKAAVKRPVSQKTVGVSTKAVQPVKLVRDSFSFPEHEHALLADMKKRALKLGKDFKKSEILRAGISHLAGLADSALLTLLSKVERVKTGRPAKKGKKK